MDFDKFKREALAQARKWAKAGNGRMAQYYVERAGQVGWVSDQQIAALNRMLAKAWAAKDQAAKDQTAQ